MMEISECTEIEPIIVADLFLVKDDRFLDSDDDKAEVFRDILQERFRDSASSRFEEQHKVQVVKNVFDFSLQIVVLTG